MDLNYLLYRHQVSVMRAAASVCASTRRSHDALAQGYAERVANLQSQLGADAAPLGVTA